MSHRRSGRRSGKKKNKSRKTRDRDKYNKAKHNKELRRQLKKRQNLKVSEKRRIAAEAGRQEAAARAAAAELVAWQQEWTPRRDSGLAWFRPIRNYRVTGPWSLIPDTRPTLGGLLRRLLRYGCRYDNLILSPTGEGREGVVAGGAFLLLDSADDTIEIWLPDALTEHDQAILRLLRSYKFSYLARRPPTGPDIGLAMLTAVIHKNVPSYQLWSGEDELRLPIGYTAPQVPDAASYTLAVAARPDPPRGGLLARSRSAFHRPPVRP